MTAADAIDRRVTALERALRGPRRLRRDMVAEARAGLYDAADAYQATGLAPELAAEHAVRDFGSVDEVAPAFQEELTTRQGRGAATLLAVVFPAMLLGWDLLWSTGLLDHGSAAAHVRVLARLQDLVTVLTAGTALTLFALGALGVVAPRRLTRWIGVTGLAGGLTCGGLAVGMNLAADPAALLSPVELTAFVTSAAMLVLIVWQSVRALKVARTG